LENRPTAFSEEFVMDLARLELAELPIAIRVAREACKEHQKLARNRSKSVSVGNADGWQPERLRQVSFSRVGVGHTESKKIVLGTR
jgi:hypothetical protein